MKGIGFRSIDSWPGCYTHPPNDGLFMTVYIDDFMLAGPAGAAKSMWKRAAEVVSIEPPTPMEGIWAALSAVSTQLSPRPHR